jgi:signal transduction histidine kinase
MKTEKTDSPMGRDIFFFGTVTASISHEIKNVMTTINETAGLLDDFALQAQRTGSGLEPDRAREAAAAIARNIRRADSIVRNLNRFAHSADRDRATIRLGELLDLFSSLTARLAANKGASVQVTNELGDLEVFTAPFSLLHLLWRSLEFILVKEGASGQIQLLVSAAKTEDGSGQQVALIWENSTKEAMESEADFPGQVENDLMARMPEPCRLRLEKNRMVLLLG